MSTLVTSGSLDSRNRLFVARQVKANRLDALIKVRNSLRAESHGYLLWNSPWYEELSASNLLYVAFSDVKTLALVSEINVIKMEDGSNILCNGTFYPVPISEEHRGYYGEFVASGKVEKPNLVISESDIKDGYWSILKLYFEYLKEVDMPVYRYCVGLRNFCKNKGISFKNVFIVSIEDQSNHGIGIGKVSVKSDTFINPVKFVFKTVTKCGYMKIVDIISNITVSKDIYISFYTGNIASSREYLIASI